MLLRVAVGCHFYLARHKDRTVFGPWWGIVEYAGEVADAFGEPGRGAKPPDIDQKKVMPQILGLFRRIDP